MLVGETVISRSFNVFYFLLVTLKSDWILVIFCALPLLVLYVWSDHQDFLLMLVVLLVVEANPLSKKTQKLAYKFGIFDEGGYLGIHSYPLNKTYFQISFFLSCSE